jgi:cysteine desulfurase
LPRWTYRSGVSGYFDAATATPLHPTARAALQAALDEGWADPDRVYREGRRARQLLDGARAAVAETIGVSSEEVTFCPSGTTAGHLAVMGTAAARRRTGNRIVAGAVEHSSVLAATRHHEDNGGVTTVVGVDRDGAVDPAAFLDAVSADTAVAVLQSANHEVGTIQPVEAVGAGCREQGVPLYVDAAQSVGRVALPDAWDLLTASARKWGGPAGVGILAVRRGTRWRSPWPEDEHERGRMPGVVSLPLVLAAAASLQARQSEREGEADRLSGLVDRIRTEVVRRVPDVEMLGDPDHRLPHLVAFSCLYVAGEAIQIALDRVGFSVSSGSSCSSSALTPSHVLEAMGVLTHGNVRVSLHGGVDTADVDRFLDALPPIVAELRRTAGAQGL